MFFKWIVLASQPASVQYARMRKPPYGYLSYIGKKGGKASGACKVRGDSEHYRKMGLLSAAKRAEKRKAKGV